MPRAMLRRARIERWITYVLWAVMAASIVWGTAIWVDYLSEKAAEAEQQTKHMVQLLERSERRQEQMGTLIREFRESVKAEEESRRKFENKADAILKALDVQVERMSYEPAGSAPRVRRIVGQAGAAPRSREPPAESEPAAEPEPAHDHPPPEPKPPPKPRAEPAPPPRSQPPPQANKPSQPTRQADDDKGRGRGRGRGRGGDKPGKAKGHHKQSPGKAKGKR